MALQPRQLLEQQLRLVFSLENIHIILNPLGQQGKNEPRHTKTENVDQKKNYAHP